jgi:hypothetical protein
MSHTSLNWQIIYVDLFNYANLISAGRGHRLQGVLVNKAMLVGGNIQNKTETQKKSPHWISHFKPKLTKLWLKRWLIDLNRCGTSWVSSVGDTSIKARSTQGFSKTSQLPLASHSSSSFFRTTMVDIACPPAANSSWIVRARACS